MLPRGFYTVESFIGRGGMGAVYKGVQTTLKRPVAIKIMRQDHALDAEFRLRFLREAQMLARLSHPGIVNVIDCGEAGPDFLFIVMEFVDGANLMDVIRSGGVSETRALTIMKLVCEALQFAHSHGIVHRDIKPSNIILMRDGRIKLADFGLATAMEPEDGAQDDSDHALGTPAYAAPEQLTAGQAVDQRADIYALGVMIYQMLTGELPKGDWKPPSQTVAVDPAWDKIITQALQAQPQDRLSAADAMQALLSRISPLSGEQIQRRRPRSLLLTVGIALLALITWVILGGNQRDKNYPVPERWVDTTPELKDIARRFNYGHLEDRWLRITEDAHFDIAVGRQFSDVALRVTCTGCVWLGLRGTMNQFYVGYVRPDGDASISTTYSKDEAAKFALGKSFDPLKEYELVFAAQGDEMRLWLDGREVLSLKDTHLKQGRLCMGAIVSPEPKVPAGILRLEYAPLGGSQPPEPPPRPSFVAKPGSIAHTLTSPDFKWTPPVNLGPAVNAAGRDLSPYLSADSLILTYLSVRNNTSLLHESRRPSIDAAFGQPQAIPDAGSWSGKQWIAADRRTMLCVRSDGPGNLGSSQDLYMLQRADDKAPWGPPVNLQSVNYQGHDQSPNMSSDGLTLYFGSLRTGGYGGHDMWKATRKTLKDDFGNITNLGPTINTWIQERDMHLCSDDRTLLFVRQQNEDTVSTSVLHMAVPDEGGGYHVQPLDVPFQGMMFDPCLSHDGRTLLFAWQGPTGSGEQDIWQMQRVPKDAVVTTPQPALATVDTPFANTLGMRFVPVPITGGHTHKQRVLFSVWETRVQDYAAFVKATGHPWQAPPFEQGPMHPAVNISWHDAQAFCRWLTAIERKAGIISQNEHYRVPLDREWSCAVGIGDLEAPTASPFGKHGGLPDVFLWGSKWPPPPDAANFRGEECLPRPGESTTNTAVVLAGRSDPFIHTAPVGSFKLGPHGLLDLAGNVREWCEEWYHADRQEIRVLRGGDFSLNDGDKATAASRQGSPPALQTFNTGLRVVLGPGAGPDVKGLLDPPPPPATPIYPEQANWIDLTDSVRSDVLTTHRGELQGEWLHITKPGETALFSKRPFKNVALRATYKGRLFLIQRDTPEGHYVANLNLQEVMLWVWHPDEKRKPSFPRQTIPLGKDYDPKQEHTATFVVNGNQLALWIDGKLIATQLDNTFPIGSMAIQLFSPNETREPLWIKKVEYAELQATASKSAPVKEPEPPPTPPPSTPEPLPAPLPVPEPATWVDATPLLRDGVTKAGAGTVQGDWLILAKPYSMVINGNQVIRDGVARMKFKGAGGLVMRWTPTGRNYQSMLVERGMNQRSWDSTLRKQVLFDNYAKFDPGFDLLAEHELVVAVQGDLMSAWLDGRLMMTQRDSSTPEGAIAVNLAVSGNNTALHPQIRKVEYGVLK